MTKQTAAEQGVTEELKFREQMAWMRAMNTIRNAVAEIMLTEIIYTLLKQRIYGTIM